MLSFELSAIDLILAIAVIITLILHITKPSAKPPTEEKPTTEDATPEKETKRPTPTQPQTDTTRCPYGFGYLKNLDKGATIPEKCLSCPKIMECYSANE